MIVQLEKLNILNISFTIDGGAGLAVKEFNRFLVSSGHNSLLVVKESRNKDDNVIILTKNYQSSPCFFVFNKVCKKFKRLIKRIKLGPLDDNFSFFNTDETKSDFTATEILKLIPFKPDVIFIHWVSWFINSRTILELYQQTKSKIFWLMMDISPLTGGCHYAWDCRGFEKDCGSCPAIIKQSRKKVAGKNLLEKRNNLPECLQLLTCSQPDYLKAINSSVYKNKIINTFLLPVDEDLFYPSENIELQRELFGLPQGKKIILFGGLSLNQKRKGLEYLIGALHKLKESLQPQERENIHLAIIGNKFKMKGLLIPFESTELGQIPYARLPFVFQVADMFVSPSIEDSGPLMINQSLMCGTPVVAFDIGVAKNLVIDNYTGYKANRINPYELGLCLYNLIIKDKNETLRIRKNCRFLALNNYSFKSAKDKINSILYAD